jgi:nucleoid-associated protein YgaU
MPDAGKTPDMTHAEITERAMEADPTLQDEVIARTQEREGANEQAPGESAPQRTPGAGSTASAPAREEPQWEHVDTGRTHTVADGDTLRSLAERFLGSAEQWNRIYEVNMDRLGNPDSLYPGQELAIPSQ